MMATTTTATARRIPRPMMMPLVFKRRCGTPDGRCCVSRGGAGGGGVTSSTWCVGSMGGGADWVGSNGNCEGRVGSSDDCKGVLRNTRNNQELSCSAYTERQEHIAQKEDNTMNWKFWQGRDEDEAEEEQPQAAP